MTIYNIQEVKGIFDSFGPKCDVEMVEQWIKEGQLKGYEDNNGTYKIHKEDVDAFIYAYRWDGTAYEKGIDEKTKIIRLLEEIDELKQDNEKLWKKIGKLEMKLNEFGVAPF